MDEVALDGYYLQISDRDKTLAAVRAATLMGALNKVMTLPLSLKMLNITF